MRILVVEDESRTAQRLARSLGGVGYAVDLALNEADGMVRFESESYDLVILDLVHPGVDDGEIALCRAIRAEDTDVPILMLTAQDSAASRVIGLDAGADDYLVKPVYLVELHARVRALLRRAPRADAPVLEAQGVRLHPASRSAERGGRQIPLTAKEFAVLEYLMRNAGSVVSVSMLLDHAWDQSYVGLSNVVPTYIRYLRRKLTAAGEADIIQTRRGSGYLIAPDR